MSVRFLAAILSGGVIFTAVPARAAAEQVAMPFQCKVDRGRVVLAPSPVERVYEVQGAHRQQPHLFCPPRGERRCRPRTLHRFEVMCGNARTTWVAVAAAATRMLGHEAWIESGRLNVVVGVGTTVTRTDCGDSAWPRSLTHAFSGSPAFDRPCNPRLVERGGPRVITLPAGFAPLTELGARLVEGVSRPAPSASVTPERPVPVSLPAPPQVAAIALPPVTPPASSEPPPAAAVALAAPSVPPGVSTVVPASRDGAPAMVLAASSDEVQLPSRWMVTVHPDEGPAAALMRLRAALASDQWLFAIGLLTATLAVGGLTFRTVGRHGGPLARRRRSASLDRLVRQANLVSLDDPDERVLNELRATAEQLRSNAELVLGDLASAPPLRGVLRQEVDLITQRLSDVPRSNGVIGPRQIRQRYQGGIRELHRVIRIAEGAAASFSAGALRPAVPTSREEAYDMLGVNDSISEATLKKLVDALRLSWHPDHARDESDRLRREERIKQINVAWDLITGRRLTV